MTGLMEDTESLRRERLISQLVETGYFTEELATTFANEHFAPVAPVTYESLTAVIDDTVITVYGVEDDCEENIRIAFVHGAGNGFGVLIDGQFELDITESKKLVAFMEKSISAVVVE